MSLTHAPVHLVDGVAIDTVATRALEGGRCEQGGVHLDEGEEEEEGSARAPGHDGGHKADIGSHR